MNDKISTAESRQRVRLQVRQHGFEYNLITTVVWTTSSALTSDFLWPRGTEHHGLPVRLEHNKSQYARIRQQEMLVTKQLCRIYTIISMQLIAILNFTSPVSAYLVLSESVGRSMPTCSHYLRFNKQVTGVQGCSQVQSER